MRTWRVGTVSMGLTLLFLGVFLVLSQLLNWKPAYTMISWWSIILIVLGAEILIYLFTSKQENPIVKYDLFSIFFVSIIGFCGIGFAAVSATGIMDKLHDWTNYEVRTIDLPTYSTKLDDTIKRIVVDTGSDPLTIETGTTKEVAIFGTYVSEVVNDNMPIKVTEDYLFTEKKGDTLFVTLKTLPEELNPFGYHRERNATLVIPSNLQVEIEANHQQLNVNTRKLLNNWTIENAMDVNVKLSSDLDITLHAKNVEHIQDKDKWKMLIENDNDDEDKFQDGESGTLQVGKGTYVINILNTSNVSIITK